MKLRILVLSTLMLTVCCAFAKKEAKADDNAKPKPTLFDAYACIPALTNLTPAPTDSLNGLPYHFDNSLTEEIMFTSDPVSTLDLNKVAQKVFKNMLNGGTDMSTIKQRTVASAGRVARENTSALNLGEFDLADNVDAMQKVLVNNFVLVKYPKAGAKEVQDTWAVYRIVVPEDMNYRLLKLGDVSEIDQIPFEYELVAEGKWKQGEEKDQFGNVRVYDNLEDIQRDIMKDVPPLAARGGIIDSGSRFTVSRLGKVDIPKLSNGAMFYAYGTRLDKKTGEPYSKKIATLRATHVSEGSMRSLDDSDSTLFYNIGGRNVHPGDIVVYRPDNKMSVSIAGMYSNRLWGARLGVDYLVKMNRTGIGQYAMLNVDYLATNSVYDVAIEDKDGIHTVKAYSELNFRIGYGLGMHFWHWFEVRPYVTVGGSLPILIYNPFENTRSSDSESGVSKDMSWLVTPGVKFNLNICYPVQFTCGAEYNLRINSDKFKDFYNGGDGIPILKHERKSCAQFYAGIRVCF